jgi:hypothetical protein
MSLHSSRVALGTALGVVALIGSACDKLTEGRVPDVRGPLVERGPHGAALMPPEAHGVALGMDWPSLQLARPRVTHERGPLEHGGFFESLSEATDSALIHYYFSDSTQPDTAFARGLSNGVLSMVEITLRGIPSDTGTYNRVLTSISTRWDSLVGPADSTSHCWYRTPAGESGPREWRTWRRPDVILLLHSLPDSYVDAEPDPDSLELRRPRGASRSITMIVQSARLPVGTGFFGLLRNGDRCTAVKQPLGNPGAKGPPDP